MSAAQLAADARVSARHDDTGARVSARHVATGAPVIECLAAPAMATRFELVLVGEDRTHLRAAGEAALDEIRTCHARFTRFERSSLVSFLMREAPHRAVALDAPTFELFALAERVRSASGGAFSVLHDSQGALELDAARHTLRLHGAGARLDLGALAKGHALDLAADVLREYGVAHALLHGGTSSLLALGPPLNGAPWRVARAGSTGTLELRDRALSVSAQSARDLFTGQPLTGAHIVDARTGELVAETRRVAVLAHNAALADAWSTALLALERAAWPHAQLCAHGIEALID